MCSCCSSSAGVMIAPLSLGRWKCCLSWCCSPDLRIVMTFAPLGPLRWTSTLRGPSPRGSDFLMLEAVVRSDASVNTSLCQSQLHRLSRRAEVNLSRALHDQLMLQLSTLTVRSWVLRASFYMLHIPQKTADSQGCQIWMQVWGCHGGVQA